MDQKTNDSPLAPGKLVRRFSRPINSFKSIESDDARRDVYSIALEQAIIGSFVGENKYSQPAEVAILANAFEFDAASVENSRSRFYEFPEIVGPRRDASGAASAASQGMKLIYFNSDVYLNQPLNFSALPIVAPKRYQGRPIGIQIVILELDRMSGPLKSLLRQLASLGQASNAASPVPGIGSAALELGSSLLDGNTNNDDIVFEYRMVLYPAHLSASAGDGTRPKNEIAEFQPGRYVIRRVENRATSMTWSDMFLDHNTSRLFRIRKNDKNPPTSSGGAAENAEATLQDDKPVDLIEHRDDTYLVVNIMKHAPGTPEAKYAFQSLANLNDALDAASSTDGSSSLNALTDNLRLRVEDARSKAWFSEVDGKWSLLRDALVDFEVHRYPESDANVSLLDSDKCVLFPDFQRKNDLVSSRLRVQQASNAFVEAYNRAMSAKVAEGTEKSQFGEAERKTLSDAIALYVVPKLDSSEAKFRTESDFRSNFVTGKGGVELSETLLEAMRNAPKPMSCSQVVSSGWGSFKPQN